MNYRNVIFVILICFAIYANAHTGQKSAVIQAEESNPFLDIAMTFLQETLANQNSGRGGGGGGDSNGNGFAGIAQLIGSLVQQDGSSKSNGGMGAAQILSGISQLINANSGRNGGNSNSAIDPSIIGNVIEMFTSNAGADEDEQSNVKRRRRSNSASQDGIGLDTILEFASAFMGNSNDVDGQASKSNEGLISLLPMALQAINSFVGPDGEKVHAKHKDHQWVLPPFLERIHVMWDHFSNSELAEALWEKSGVNTIFKVRKSNF